MYRRKPVKTFVTLGEIDGWDTKIKVDKLVLNKIKNSLKDTVNRMEGLGGHICKLRIW